ncbi:MAG TPA: glycosyltransferase [Acidimicrobiales bacterium]|nr:glycosyltransferase [Acidimicrobiales bacterium]
MMRVSVVISTLDRAEGLRQTLRALRYQTHGALEVVVVNGPSTDFTQSVLDEFDDIKVESCPLPNLSMSRNIGIRAAAGEIVAFIDDDAIPEFSWIEELIAGYTSDDIAGVGGVVLDHTGACVQFRFSASNRLGDVVESITDEMNDWCTPGAWQFPYLQGTNASFRREALAEIGLFDETFDYFLDETDVCCRLVDAGHRIRSIDGAAVHHKSLPSSVRNEHRAVRHWFPVMKNRLYFGLRHALDYCSEPVITDAARRFADAALATTERHERLGEHPPGTHEKAIRDVARAFVAGAALASQRVHLRLGPSVLPSSDFRTFETHHPRSRRRIVIVSSGYTPRITGGIARFMSDVAPALTDLGYEARVITRGSGHTTVDLEDGVWVHRVEVPTDFSVGALSDAPRPIDAFATAVLHEVQRLGQWYQADLVYGSLWDVEVLGLLRQSMLPVVPMLATPVVEVARYEGWTEDPALRSMTDQLMALETEVLQHADVLHAISTAIAATIADRYDVDVPAPRWHTAQIGLSEPEIDESEVRGTQPINVLFVGRLEPRKGIDVLIAAANLLADRGITPRFVIAGNHSRPLAGGLTYEQAWRCERAGHVLPDLTFEGEVSDGELRRRYQRADLVVMPSRYESFGLVLLEAMMLAKPVVASAVGGIKEIVRPGVDGLLVAIDDPQALADAINVLIDEADLRRSMGANGRQRFLDQFTSRRAAQRLAELFERITVTSPHDFVDAGATRDWFSDGTPCLRLGAPAAVSVKLDRCAARHFTFWTDSRATLRLRTPREETLVLEPHRVVRVEVDASAQEVQVVLDTGSCLMGSILSVDVREGSA